MKRNDFIDGILTLQNQVHAADLRESEYPTIVLEFPTISARVRFEQRVIRDTNVGDAIGHKMVMGPDTKGFFAEINGIKVKLVHWGTMRGLIP